MYYIIFTRKQHMQGVWMPVCLCVCVCVERVGRGITFLERRFCKYLWKKYFIIRPEKRLYVWELYLGWLSSMNVYLSVRTNFAILKSTFWSNVKLTSQTYCCPYRLSSCVGCACASLTSNAFLVACTAAS